MVNIGDLTIDELKSYIKDIGESAFRADQIYKWVHSGIESFNEMSNISLKLREKLSENFSVYLPTVYKKFVSKLDGTVKYLFELFDGNIIEAVVMDYHHGKSICVSSQVGCRMGCSFCASTLNGLSRNLTPFEIEGQIIRAQKDMNIRIANIVIMGIGEPLDNYENVINFIKNTNSSQGLNIGCRHITLSTCGLCDKIYDLSDSNLPINLAISLHAPTDESRKALMKVANAYSIQELMKACNYYFEKTHRRITFEYALVKDKNSTPEDARTLAKLLQGKNCHINLIPVNPVRERQNTRISKKDMDIFKKTLEENGINATVRRELGRDINASCGQLRNQELKWPKK